MYHDRERGGGGRTSGSRPGLEGAPSSARPLVGNADARVRQTIAAMQEVTLDSLRDPDIAATAADIVQHVDGRDRRGQIEAIRSWLAGRVRFLADPLIDGDVIRTPGLLLSQLARDGFMQGDCDDVATLSATLTHAVGVPARFVLYGFGGPSAPYSHVFTEAQDQYGVWHELDVTETPERRAAQEPSRAEAHPVLRPQAAGLGALLGLAQFAIVAVEVARGFQRIIDEWGDADV